MGQKKKTNIQRHYTNWLCFVLLQKCFQTNIMFNSQRWVSLKSDNVYVIQYSKTCLKRSLKNKQNKRLKAKW